ncbi:MAG: hypothetical protein AAF432_07825 [Planctomycetota bacterium]
MADVQLMDLWLPILVGGVVGFFMSFLLWAVLPHHNAEWKKLPNEDAMMAEIRSGSVPPGQYMFPRFENMSDLKDPEKKKRYEEGPMGMVAVWPGVPNMGLNMVLTFLFYLVSCTLIAYVGTVALDKSVERITVFQLLTTVSVMTFAFGSIPNGIWFRKPLRAVVTEFLDCLLTGSVIGAVFAMLWPITQAAGRA